LEPTQANAKSNRSAGILFHPTSLPGPYGIGDLGPAAFAWIDALARAGQTWWQVLPLGPTGFGDSPYQSFSAFAGNPYLVSPDFLVRDGLIKRSDLDSVSFPPDRVDFGPVITFKSHLHERAWENFRAGAGSSLRSAFETFCTQHAAWPNCRKTWYCAIPRLSVPRARLWPTASACIGSASFSFSASGRR
jgi:4-alpha-glucanotransferase